MSDDNALVVPADMQDQYNRMIGEWNRKMVSIPEIKISYGDDSKGEYVMKDGDETKVLGKKITGVILKVRNQYSMYADKPEDGIKTNEFDGFDENITLYKGGNAIKTGMYQDVKAVIKEEYPDAKYINIIYFLMDDKICRIYSKPGSRQNLWDFQAATSGKAPFAFTTELTTKKNSHGNVTYYAMEFKRADDFESEEIGKNLKLRIELDRTLKQLDMAKPATSKASEPQAALPADDDDIEAIAGEVFS